jgi:hypothetical protein
MKVKSNAKYYDEIKLCKNYIRMCVWIGFQSYKLNNNIIYHSVQLISFFCFCDVFYFEFYFYTYNHHMS